MLAVALGGVVVNLLAFRILAGRPRATGTRTASTSPRRSPRDRRPRRARSARSSARDPRDHARLGAGRSARRRADRPAGHGQRRPDHPRRDCASCSSRLRPGVEVTEIGRGDGRPPPGSPRSTTSTSGRSPRASPRSPHTSSSAPRTTATLRRRELEAMLARSLRDRAHHPADGPPSGPGSCSRSRASTRPSA